MKALNVLLAIAKGVFRTLFFPPIYLWKKCFEADYIAEHGYVKAFMQFLACTIIFYGVVILGIGKVMSAMSGDAN